MSTTKTAIQLQAEQEAEHRFPDDMMEGTPKRAKTFASSEVRHDRTIYAACLEERAIPAEQALRVAMEYINALRSSDAYNQLRIRTAIEALRANPITAKMMEE